ncbi:34242_t:CDS:2, partial [Racocetra persica]
TNEENSRKRTVDLVEETENSLESEEEHATNSSNWQSSTKKKSRQKAEKNHEHYEATYYYYIPKKSWARGKPATLEAYLANKCSNSLPNQIAIISHFLSDYLLPKAAINRLDKKIIKVWVIAGIPFEVIKNLFIKD